MYPFATLISLPFSGKKDEGMEKPVKEEKGEDAKNEHVERIYKKIIERYRGLIEEHEAKSVVELRGRVKPNNQRIEKIAKEIMEKYHPYGFGENFLDAAKDAVEIVSKIKAVGLPVNFWFSYDEIFELGAADSMDKSILLCSILRALGSEDATVFLTSTKEAYVGWSAQREYFLFNAKINEVKEGETGELKKGIGGLLYSFNDKEYEDYSEVDVSD